MGIKDDIRTVILKTLNWSNKNSIYVDELINNIFNKINSKYDVKLKHKSIYLEKPLMILVHKKCKSELGINNISSFYFCNNCDIEVNKNDMEWVREKEVG